MMQPPDTALQNPFVGLRPYRSEESLYFFGRGEQTKRLLGLLHKHHFVAVVGSSRVDTSSGTPPGAAGFRYRSDVSWVAGSGVAASRSDTSPPRSTSSIRR